MGGTFAFGRNWRRFLPVINEERIGRATDSLRTMLQADTLSGRSFLDVGCGSGLFSLSARRLGARVRSFDADPDSVLCAAELRARHFPDDPAWTISSGNVLDEAFMRSLGRFDIVYAWGVLHHTGDLRKALANAALPVAEAGQLFIAIYNDQGSESDRWRRVKEIYGSGALGRAFILGTFVPYFAAREIGGSVVHREWLPARLARYKRERGMSLLHDWVDWLGGYPFEVARPEDVFRFYRDRGFALRDLVTCGGGLGNNQFVFVRK
jgi:2-polyprenyl-6-hydroxyphenyl methylase/3-demethylubiquinone-9 3-methyltransferase